MEFATNLLIPTSLFTSKVTTYLLGRIIARTDTNLDEPYFLPSAPHIVNLPSLLWYFTGYSMIIAIIMKKQLPDPFYNVRVVNYLLGTMLFGTQQREQTE